MLAGGEDPAYILRRLTRFAVEDVGLAEPQAVAQAIACWETYDRPGPPEGDLAISPLVVFMATAPKSNAPYKAPGPASPAAGTTGPLVPPGPYLDPPTPPP